MEQIVAFVAAVFVLIGVVQQYFGTVLVGHFSNQPVPDCQKPLPVTVLKPLCGVDPLTELALESFFLLDYPEYQLVFGVQNAADPVRQILSALQARYPSHDVSVVVDAALHGTNRKISNLINMLRFAKHEILVMSDADIHVPPYFLHRVVAALEQPGVGLVTTLYTGLAGTPRLATNLGATQINHIFLPGALLARQLGRQDCLGVTMALTRATLGLVGGLPAVANHLADDQVLGRLVLARGLALTLAPVIPATTVPEANFSELFHHELRWARTIRALVPVPYAASILQFSLFWAVLAVLAAGFALWACSLFAAVLLLRTALARRIDGILRLAAAPAAWLLLLRDFFSVIVYVVSFCGATVQWRGQTMHADPGKTVKS